MFLLNIQSGHGDESPVIQLKFYLADVPPYAILSHRWGAPADEVTFQDMMGDASVARRKKGYRKLEACCVQAKKDGFSNVWIDTCCIDKTSSAELSESINSMYEWYRSAETCYAYMEDVTSEEKPQAENSSFRRSSWFTRGWTLQELIAPATVTFFAGDWTPIGDKTTLGDLVEEITNVRKDILLDRNNLSLASVAQKMSWASRRVTTRPEDEAYSLIGLFNVNMPAIYGEGRRAFIRLQQEIMRISNDHTIFAWEADSDFSGMLATSPSQFANSAGYVPMQYDFFTRLFNISVKYIYPTDVFGVKIPTGGQKPDYAMTNFGLHIQLPLTRPLDHFDNVYVAFLACTHGEEQPVIIFLRRSPGRPKGHFYRTRLNNRFTHRVPPIEGAQLGIEDEIVWVSVNGPQSQTVLGDAAIPASKPDRFEFCVETHLGPDGSPVKIIEVHPPELVNLSDDCTQADMSFQSGSHVALVFQHEATGQKLLFVCGAHEGRVWFNFHYDTAVGTAEESYGIYDLYEWRGFWYEMSSLIKFVDDVEIWETSVGNFLLTISRVDEGVHDDKGIAIEKLKLSVRHAAEAE